MFASVSQNITLRFNEVRTLLNEIKGREVTPPTAEPEIVAILRGLFFVQLYGAFEYSITQAVQSLLQLISSTNVQYKQLEPLFYAVALDAKFSAIADTGPRKKWIARKNLLIEQGSIDVCSLNDTVFHHDLQNIWYTTLAQLFESLCVTEPVLPEARLRGYIDEVVNSRNAIAHGRESPTTAGRMHSADLEIRFDAIVKTAMHITLCFERHLENRTFVDASHRADFIAP